MNKVRKISQMLREDIAVPVFEFTLPDGYAKKCIVVSEHAHDYLLDEGEFHVNIYAPNITRTVENHEDHSCPDRDAIDDLYLQVGQVLRTVWTSEFDLNVLKSQLIRDGAMHYLNICLTIQFN